MEKVDHCVTEINASSEGHSVHLGLVPRNVSLNSIIRYYAIQSKSTHKETSENPSEAVLVFKHIDTTKDWKRQRNCSTSES